VGRDLRGDEVPVDGVEAGDCGLDEDVQADLVDVPGLASRRLEDVADGRVG